jgi:hypothetical protein
MKRGICLTAAFIVLSFPAVAQDSCVVPYAPTVPKGETATRDQILSTRDLVMAFIKASDDYQNCLRVYLDQQEQLAAREQRQVEAAVRASVLAKGDANQREKERTGIELNAAVRAYNAANPPAP